ncbi:MAG: fibronectin type III domain-containing protein [Actinomycetota bacterium]
MRPPAVLVAPLAAALFLGACAGESPREAAQTQVSDTNAAGEDVVPFKEARLIVEINATDGDAGFQVFLDHEPWKSIAIFRPDGTKLVDLQTEGVLVDYGLTELFWESSEPPFSEFPIEKFMELFPEGDYTFEGETIDGVRMRSAVPLSHDFPAGPKILFPTKDSTVSADNLVVRWKPVPEPGVEIARYQVIVVREKGGTGDLEADLPASARRLTVPAEFMAPGAEYKVEVLAIEASGNQTLTEVPFATE